MQKMLLLRIFLLVVIANFAFAFSVKSLQELHFAFAFSVKSLQELHNQNVIRQQ